MPFLLLMLIIPETPRWYVSHGRDEQARKALQWLRGKQADVEPELKGIIKTHTDSERHASSNGLKQLLRRNNLKPLSISLGLMFFQQFSGINAVIFYTGKIFGWAGSTLDTNLCSIIVGVVNFISTFIATFLIDRLGRKVRKMDAFVFLLSLFSNIMRINTDQMCLFVFLHKTDSALHFIDGYVYNIVSIGWILLHYGT